MTTVTRPALLSAVAYILQAIGATPAELAQHMGAKLEAAPIVLPPTDHDPDALTPREAEVLQRIDNPNGASVPELMAVMSLSIQAVSGYVSKLQRLGKIVRVKAPGVRSPRCFVDPAAAQRWHDSHAQAAEQARQQAMQKHLEADAERQRREAEKAAEKQAQQALREQARAQARQDRAEKAAASAGLRAARKPPKPEQNVTMFPAKVQGPALRGEAVIPAGVKPQVDDKVRPVARWQTQQLPADPRWPSFAATPPGTNPETGRPWA